ALAKSLGTPLVINEKALKIGYALYKKRYPLESTKMYKKLGKGYE
ncbi:MAG: Pyruvate ferredoxin/flavodoxin oxidoreductase, partial [Petrotoga mobilis]